MTKLKRELQQIIREKLKEHQGFSIAPEVYDPDEAADYAHSLLEGKPTKQMQEQGRQYRDQMRLFKPQDATKKLKSFPKSKQKHEEAHYQHGAQHLARAQKNQYYRDAIQEDLDEHYFPEAQSYDLDEETENQEFLKEKPTQPMQESPKEESPKLVPDFKQYLNQALRELRQTVRELRLAKQIQESRQEELPKTLQGIKRYLRQALPELTQAKKMQGVEDHKFRDQIANSLQPVKTSIHKPPFFKVSALSPPRLINSLDTANILPYIDALCDYTCHGQFKDLPTITLQLTEYLELWSTHKYAQIEPLFLLRTLGQVFSLATRFETSAARLHWINSNRNFQQNLHLLFRCINNPLTQQRLSLILLSLTQIKIGKKTWDTVFTNPTGLIKTLFKKYHREFYEIYTLSNNSPKQTLINALQDCFNTSDKRFLSYNSVPMVLGAFIQLHYGYDRMRSTDSWISIEDSLNLLNINIVETLIVLIVERSCSITKIDQKDLPVSHPIFTPEAARIIRLRKPRTTLPIESKHRADKVESEQLSTDQFSTTEDDTIDAYADYKGQRSKPPKHNRWRLWTEIKHQNPQEVKDDYTVSKHTDVASSNLKNSTSC